MKQILLLITLLVSLFTYSQNITVDSQTYTPQQLIEDILIDSDCINNITVTNVVGGDFGGTDQSYGYFDATGVTSGPFQSFQSGIVLSTGRLSNVPGPNTSLSDDDADNWIGDADLENALNETGTTNATILEFDFISVASQVSFRYIFASEEYQVGNPNSCRFSDLFGFLIRPSAGQEPYENIALVPNTNTPVKVTTVTPGVEGSCPPENVTYFDTYNDASAPINFNGQTDILTATANVTPNVTYHVKLVIADEGNARYDSAVFLEAGSFELSSDIGPNRLISTRNALCEGETIELNAYQDGQNTYDWYRNNVLVQGAPVCSTCGSYIVTEPGTYTVEVTLVNDCISYGAAIIEYANLPIGTDSILIECDLNQDGITTYNLFDASDDLLIADGNALVDDFFLSRNDADEDINSITNPEAFENTFSNQPVFARIINQANCYVIAELILQTSNNIVNIQDFNGCDGEIIDGFANFNLSEIEDSILDQIPLDANVRYYETEDDAFNETNSLSNTFENTIANTQTIYVKVNSNNQCFSISTANLNVLYTPLLEDDETFIYCLNTEPLTIFGGVLNDLPNNYYYEWQFNGTTTEVTTLFNDVTEPGIYTVIVTDPNGCSSSRTITILPSEIAIIESVNIVGIAPNNMITISLLNDGNGDYEIALDNENGPYQERFEFNNISEGFHTVYIKDKNGCGTIEETISVLGFPRFFTPNGDEFNPTWQVIGSDAQFNSIASIQIFNRFGKLIAEQTTISGGWDGTLNGKSLPSDDYWFIAQFLDGTTYTGHFALRR